ncbi:hypothetical protein FO440_23830 [Mucilaginibacter corticis]|uniref:UDP-N-acetylglucosamine kinase n=1 Tax=Mucilaginibacter corticis TaxID=2597670 RepID=A0A556M7R0_9SPHI|nr:hypothetical protein [Mucilaginibacter corticis]TSJ35951.1 hypothetical protein FO440_23830 [Mucilaginibacter corticis]
MPELFVIAGPPGIGKSMNGQEFTRAGIEIINENDNWVDDQKNGFSDSVKRQLRAGNDFAYELSLSSREHYDYIRAVKAFNPGHKLIVNLFFTDSLQLCFDRARSRHENGSHFVPPERIAQMYNDIIPLLKSNFEVIDTLRLIDAKKTGQFSPAAEYTRAGNRFIVRDWEPKWLLDNLRPFLERRPKPQTSGC